MGFQQNFKAFANFEEMQIEFPPENESNLQYNKTHKKSKKDCIYVSFTQLFLLPNMEE